MLFVIGKLLQGGRRKVVVAGVEGAVEPFQIVHRQNFQTESAHGKFACQSHQDHVHAALHRIDRVVRRDNDYIFLLVRDARMIAVFPGDGENMFPHVRANVRIVTEDAGDC